MVLLSVRPAASSLLQCFRRSLCHMPVRGLTSSTIDADEVARFDRFAAGWWHENTALKTLNRLRVPLVRDALIRQHSPSRALDTATPLTGMKILDVGCGGGILSEPLARLGAEVSGIDASAELIQVAKWHADLDSSIKSRVSFKMSTVEDLCSSISADEHPSLYDGVVASEIVEHVADAELFVNACCSLVKPGGSIFFTTISRTLLSYALTIVLAEYVFGVVQRGVHDWNKYIMPHELKQILLENGFSTRLIHGMTLNPLTSNWLWISDSSVNYALHAVKPTQDTSTVS